MPGVVDALEDSDAHLDQGHPIIWDGASDDVGGRLRTLFTGLTESDYATAEALDTALDDLDTTAAAGLTTAEATLLRATDAELLCDQRQDDLPGNGNGYADGSDLRLPRTDFNELKF